VKLGSVRSALVLAVVIVAVAVATCVHRSNPPEPTPTPVPPTPTPVPSVTPAPTPSPTPTPQPRFSLLYYFTGTKADGANNWYRWGTNGLGGAKDRVTHVRVDVWSVAKDGEGNPDILAGRVLKVCQSAVSEGKRLILALDMDNRSGMWSLNVAKAVLVRCTEVWDKVDGVELTDEAEWSQSETVMAAAHTPPVGSWQLSAAATGRATELIKGLEASFGLPVKPTIVTYTQDRILNGNAYTSPTLDVVAIEAYWPTGAGPETAAETAQIVSLLNSLLAKIPGTKQVVVIGQAYGRNGAWKHLNTLTALQDRTADWVVQHKNRVAGVWLFSWGRPSGTNTPCGQEPSHANVCDPGVSGSYYQPDWRPELLSAHQRMLSAFRGAGLVQ
jgi:hypothetical protein